MHGTSEKTILSAQVATAQRDRLAHLAAANERSLSGEVRRALENHLRLFEPSPFDHTVDARHRGPSPGSAVPSAKDVA